MIPFLVNQCGSLLYVATLQTADLSLAVPVTNSLTFVVTAMAGWVLGEEKPHRSEKPWHFRMKVLVSKMVNRLASIFHLKSHGNHETMGNGFNETITFDRSSAISRILDEKLVCLFPDIYIGILMIVAGTSICCLDKLNSEEVMETLS